MSLSVTLYTKYHISYDGGKTLEEKEEENYWANITHNLGTMAEAAGIYEALWRPHKLKVGYDISENDYTAECEFEENNPSQAKEIIEVLEKGLKKLKRSPTKYEKFNSSNGWGLYKHFVPFVEKYLNACKENPNAIISVSR